MVKRWKTWLYCGLITSPIVILLLNAYIGASTRLISDDYCSIYFAQRLGFLRNIWFQYSNTQGRYSLFAMDTVLLQVGTRGLGFVTAFVLLIWGIGIITFLFGIQPQARDFKIKLRDAIGFGLAFFVVGLLLAPNLPQSLYWWNGLATHTMPLIVFALYLAIYPWLKHQRPTRTILVIAALGAFLISITAGGFSETFTIGQIVLLVYWLAWLYLYKELNIQRPAVIYLVSGLVGALIALVLAFLSPGNGIRQTQFETTTSFLGIAQIALYNYLLFLKAIFVTPEKALGIVAIAAGFFWFGQQIRTGKSSNRWEPAAFLGLISVILTYACFTPAAFGLSDAPPSRAQIIPVFFFILGIAGAAYSWGNRVSELSLNANAGVFTVTVVLLLASFGIYGKQLYDSSAVYVKYARSWDQNEQMIFDAKNAGQETVIIHSVRNWAGLNDPGDNPKFYVNYCMSKYYNINILADNTGMQLPEP